MTNPILYNSFNKTPVSGFAGSVKVQEAVTAAH
jgi:hypothetical protein